jgi:pimeloyl-ACP methyl ester carboxylesterase
VRPGLIFIHGIGRPRDTENELDAWLSALRLGLDSVGYSSLAARLTDVFECAFVNYSLLFRDKGSQGSPLGDWTSLSGDELDLVRDLLSIAASTRSGSTAIDREVVAALARARARIAPDMASQGLGSQFRNLLNAATTLLSIPGFRQTAQWATAGEFLGALSQVSRYLGRSPMRSGCSLDERIRQALLEKMGVHTSVVIAHSLGSVIAYEALQDHRGLVPLLATLGSPLAMRTLVLPRIYPQPPITPRCVLGWLDFWDSDDAIVTQALGDSGILPNGHGVAPKSHGLQSRALWSHNATKYLAHPEVAIRIGLVLDQLAN